MPDCLPKVIGREARAATFLKTSLAKSRLVGGSFASRQFHRSMASL
ncbi:MAG: hypothetical protein M3R14_17100 [Acidobacteriota bacterium]|nr:hypothetical protein [Acidobacteriota bacterium]